MNLSKYFTVLKHYNRETKQWDDTTEADTVTSYCVIKFHYNRNGAISKEQSLFKVINDDSRFDLSEIIYDTEYWQERMQYTLTAKDLSYRHSPIYDGYFVSLPLSLQEIFNNMPKIEVSLLLNLTDNWLDGKKIVGFDYNAFENFELKNIVIQNGKGNFYLLDNSLDGTNYKLFEHENLTITEVA